MLSSSGNNIATLEGEGGRKEGGLVRATHQYMLSTINSAISHKIKASHKAWDSKNTDNTHLQLKSISLQALPQSGKKNQQHMVT